MTQEATGARRVPTRSVERLGMYKDLTVIYEGEMQSLPVRAPDLSSRGMFINTARIFPEGAVLKLSFRLTGTDRHINARGEVRFCMPGVGVGVEFVEISNEDCAAIEHAVGVEYAGDEP